MQQVGALSSQSHVPGSLGTAPRNAQAIHPSIHPTPPKKGTRVRGVRRVKIKNSLGDQFLS